MNRLGPTPDRQSADSSDPNVSTVLCIEVGMNKAVLNSVLKEPEKAAHLGLGAWDLLIRQARQADLLARLGVLLQERSLLETVPLAPRRHLISAMTLAQAQHDEVRREVRWIAQALKDLSIPVVLLKGAAYVVSGNAASCGRTLTDIDILVPREAISAAEAALMLAGWITTHHDDYDQRYYRQWMHEIPPMLNARRGTVLDVHHGILPLTAHWKPDSRKLLAAAQQIEDSSGLYVLSECDRILHAITHLLCNEELSHGLRDLSDIDLQLRAGAQGGSRFWQQLIQRAEELDLSRLLAHGLRHAARLLECPVPTDVLEQARQAAGLSASMERTMGWLWTRGLDCLHPTCARPGTPLALDLLYLRAHALRMPPGLLVRHLAIKAWKRAFPADLKATTTP